MTRGSVIGYLAGLFWVARAALGADLYLAASASGADVVPPTASAAIADARVIFQDDSGHFDIDVKVRGLTPAEITGSSIHFATPGSNGPLVYDLGAGYGAVPDGAERSLGDQSLPAGANPALLAGQMYFTLQHGSPGTSIRGQILPLSHEVDRPAATGPATDGHSLAALPDGGFVSVWALGFSGVVSGQRFDANGTPVGGPFVVGSGGDPDLAPLPEGFVAVWQGPTSVMGRRFRADGTPLSPEFTVAFGTLDDPVAVASNPSGSFVVAWIQSDGHVWASLFDAAGNPGMVVAVASLTSNQAPDAAMVADGSFLLTWHNPDLFADIQARAFDATGTPFGGIIIVNDGTDPADDPHVAASDSPTSQYVVVWNENGTSNRGRRFSIGGSAFGASFPLDAGGSHTSPEVSRAADGEFVIGARSGNDVVVRRLAFNGSPASAESRAAATDGSRIDPKVAIGPQGEAWVTWLDTNDALWADRIPARMAYWSADEGSGVRITDHAGNADDVGTRMSAAWGNGISGTGLVFNGADDFVRLFSHSEPEIAGDAITVTAWVKIPALPSVIDEPFHGIYDSAADSYVLYLDKGNAELRFKATNANGEAQRPGIPEAMLRLNEWMFVAGVYDGPHGQARIYLDGQLIDTQPYAATGIPAMLPAGVPSIGRDGANYQYFFAGGIDEVEVWDRVLPVSELLAAAGKRFRDTFESGNLLAWSGRTPP